VKDWLLIRMSARARSATRSLRVLVFRSGDGEKPEPGDLKSAVDELCGRREAREDRPVTVLLVPLYEAHSMKVELTQRWGISNMEPLDLGPHVR
jgi:hypothetical protein